MAGVLAGPCICWGADLLWGLPCSDLLSFAYLLWGKLMGQDSWSEESPLRRVCLGKTCTHRWSSASFLCVKGTLRDCPSLWLPLQWWTQVRTNPQHPFSCCLSSLPKWDLNWMALCPSPFTGLKPGVKVLHSSLHIKCSVILCFSQKCIFSAALKEIGVKPWDTQPFPNQLLLVFTSGGKEAPRDVG